MKSNKYTIKVSGPAGAGVMQVGRTLSKALNSLGYFTLVYPEYPSRIRGGDNNVQIIISSNEINAPCEKIDFLVAFNKECLDEHQVEVADGGLSFGTSEIGIDEIANKLGLELVKNAAVMGFIWGMLKLDFTIIETQLRNDFMNFKNLLDSNLSALRDGFEKSEDFSKNKLFAPSFSEQIENLSGNESLTRGMLGAGLGFAAIYPMTPVNQILDELVFSDVHLFRPEDEIAGIMAAIGASYAGKRSMVATSGGGFSLMVEGLGLSGMAEIPLVIVLGQRTGPSSGLATYSSQSDLKFAISAGQGEFPRIVLTPGDITELYELAGEAFNLADRYQVPVILMTDKYLAESRFTCPAKNLDNLEIEIDRGSLVTESDIDNYKRYTATDDGVSPRAYPSQVKFLTNSYEHDEGGFSTDDSEIRQLMMAKRDKKLKGLSGGFRLYGPESAESTLISWGSSKTIMLDLFEDIKDMASVNYVHFNRVWPFPNEALDLINQSDKIIVVENNFSGQFADIVEQQAKREVVRILKDDGRPFFKEELQKMIKKHLSIYE